MIPILMSLPAKNSGLAIRGHLSPSVLRIKAAAPETGLKPQLEMKNYYNKNTNLLKGGLGGPCVSITLQALHGDALKMCSRTGNPAVDA